MKLCIFGRHPIPQGGFNGVMSLFEAIEFSRLGYETELLLPFTTRDDFRAFLEKHKLVDLNDLPRFGGHFSISPVFSDGSNFPSCDILVYQSYSADDWAQFNELCRNHSKLITKNFPKFVANPTPDSSVLHQLAYFDLVACALNEDYQLLSSVPHISSEYRHSFAYVPRGASPEMLHPGYKFGLPPTIGLDVPNNNTIDALQQYIYPIQRLRVDYPDLSVITIGREVKELGSLMVPFGRFDRIYEDFFNKIHLYCAINYEFSPSHLQASVQKNAEGWGKKAIYEVQNIEAQMSGAVLVGHRDNLIPELYIPGVTGVNYSEEADIYRTMKQALNQWHFMVGGIRRFATDQFRWSHCIKLWSDAIQARMKLPLRGQGDT